MYFKNSVLECKLDLCGLRQTSGGFFEHGKEPCVGFDVRQETKLSQKLLYFQDDIFHGFIYLKMNVLFKLSDKIYKTTSQTASQNTTDSNVMFMERKEVAKKAV